MSPQVTVYLTNYNYAKYLDQAIKSVINQTYRDFELLIIDDGSKDNSMDIIKHYEKLENVYVVLQKNKGLTVTNNIALKMARGNYFMRLDADDYLDPHCLEVMVSRFQKDDGLSLIFPDYYEVDESGEIINQIRRRDFSKDVSLLDQPAHGACSMIKTKTLKQVGGYDETFDRQDGYDLWLKMIDTYKIRNINLPLFYYRKHESSLSSDNTELLKTRAAIKKKHLEENKINPISVLGVIPTRGNMMDPRSLPLKKLGGKCLIDWTVESALNSKLLSHVLVTTPDPNIIDHIKNKFNNQIFLIKRAEGLARINEGLQNTIMDAVIRFEDDHPSPDAVMVLNIESPFKSNLYIEKAIHTLQLFDVRAVQSVIIDDGFFYEHDGNGLVPRVSNSLLRLERDNLYREAGGITIYNRLDINEKDLPETNIGHVIVDQTSAFRIDYDIDWKIAESIINTDE